MGVIEANSVEAAAAGGAARVEMISGIDFEPGGPVGDVPRRDRFDDRVVHAEQKAAAFGRHRVARVSDNHAENPGVNTPHGIL